MRFVCRSHLTNTKISIDKRRLSHIFVFVAHSPHRNKNVMFEPKKSSTRDTIFFFSSQMQKIQVTSNSTTVQPLHSLYEQLNFVRYFAANLLDSRKSEETLCDSWVLSTSVCGTGVFSAHTATHSISGNAHETQNFSTELRKTKKCQRTLDTNSTFFVLYFSFF